MTMCPLLSLAALVTLAVGTGASPIILQRGDVNPALQAREPQLNSILARESDDSTKANSFGGGSFGGGGFGGGFGASGGFGSGGFGRVNGFGSGEHGNTGLNLGRKRDEATPELALANLDEGIAGAEVLRLDELGRHSDPSVNLKRGAGASTHQAREPLVGGDQAINLNTLQPWRFDRLYKHD